MCVHPLTKKNPYYGADPVAHIHHDTVHEYLNIPCGHCDECLAVRQSSYIQRVTSESIYNHLFFATLTYDNKHLPILYLDVPSDALQKEASVSLPSLFNQDGSLCQEALDDYEALEERLDECLDDPILSGEQKSVGPWESIYRPKPEHLDSSLQVAYADIHHLQLLFKRMRDNNQIGRPFRYLAVSERGSSRGRPHFHILFFVPKEKGDSVATCESINEALKDMLLRYWSCNIGTRKHPIYERLFTYRQRWIAGRLYRNFDCHYVNPSLTKEGTADVAYYVTKYIFKENEKENNLKQLLFCKTESVQEFRAVWDIVKSRCVCSKGLGLDAVFESIEAPEQEPLAAYEVAAQMKSQISILEDLPDNDFELAPVQAFRTVWKKKRLMVPNFELLDTLRKNALLEPARGRGIYVKYNGEHIPLAAYYSRRILTYYDNLDLYFSWDSNLFPDVHDRAFALTQNDVEKIERRLDVKKKKIDEHEILDARSFDIEEHGFSVDPYDPYRGLGKYYSLDGVKHEKLLLGK